MPASPLGGPRTAWKSSPLSYWADLEALSGPLAAGMAYLHQGWDPLTPPLRQDRWRGRSGVCQVQSVRTPRPSSSAHQNVTDAYQQDLIRSSRPFFIRSPTPSAAARGVSTTTPTTRPSPC